MKVLFVTRGFPSEKDPMAGNYEAVQAKALVDKGLQVSVLSVYEDERSPRRFNLCNLVSHRRVDKIDVYESTRLYVRIRFIRRINNYLRKISYKRTFDKYIEEKGLPDIIHGHIISTSSFAIFFKKDYDIPFVITEHWSKTIVPVIPDWLKRYSCAYYQANKVICVSQVLANSLKNNFNVDSIVINNMVSDIFFRSIKINRNDNNFKFIAIGAFRRIKGFDLLVEAFAKGNFPPNVTLDIVGDGEERSFVENKIKDYGISDKIHLLGTKTPEEISDLLGLSDCFVLSSRMETFAIVVIEAMAKGLPVIATKCGGPETFLRPEHGLLIEKENVGQLTDAMKQMIEKHSNYDGEIIRKYCYDNFSQDAIADKIIDVYKQVLSVN